MNPKTSSERLDQAPARHGHHGICGILSIDQIISMPVREPAIIQERGK
ncbi:MAG: hypothetical protein OEM43_00300 [Gammaproteobacteria bacterium]|nr:hypothetical protein [Gammaproteobacteria bacterium]